MDDKKDFQDVPHTIGKQLKILADVFSQRLAHLHDSGTHMHGVHDIDTEWEWIHPTVNANDLLAVSNYCQHPRKSLTRLTFTVVEKLTFEQLVGSSRSSDQQILDNWWIQILPFINLGKGTLTHGCSQFSNIRDLYLSFIFEGGVLAS